MYRIGTIIKFDYAHDGLIEKDHSFILAENHDSEYIFQIVCISGYHKGSIEGYIRKENGVVGGVNKKHLIQELDRNFIQILWDTFEEL